MTKQSANGSTVHSLVKALELLKLFSRGKGEWRMSELVEETGFHKSSVQRILSTLEQEGFLERCPENLLLYRLGLESLLLGNAARENLGLRELARPFLEELVESTQETAHLSVVDNFQVYYVDKVDSPQAVRMVTRVGQHIPIHTSSMGKALLAHMDTGELLAGLKAAGLPRVTRHSITSQDELLAELARVRESGLAFDDEEWAPGVRCVGSPVFDHAGRAVAAVSISGPANRLEGRALQKAAQEVKTAARAISDRLGWNPPKSPKSKQESKDARKK